MIRVPHTIELVTEFDPAHPMTQRIMALPDGVLADLLVQTFIDLAKQEGFLDHLNEGNAYATVKFAKDVEDDDSK
jgi:hypothetical protein